VTAAVPDNRSAPTDGRVVAVLGLGAMGLPMTARLAGAHTVRAFDPVLERRELAEAAGAGTASTPAAAAAGADVVVVAVRDAGQTRQALLGDGSDAAGGAGGAAGAMAPGGTVVLTSTIGRDAVVQLAAELAGLGIAVVDAPVSGGAVRAEAGDLLIMVGAPDEAYGRTAAVLHRLGSSVFRAGSRVGDGQVLKTVNQLLCGVHTAAAAEALALAARLGLDLDRTVEVLGSGAASSFMLADRGPRMAAQLQSGSPPLRSRMDIIDKDMGLVAELARSVGVPVPVAAAAGQLWATAMANGLSADDDSALVRLLLPSGPN
jgi:3-hydroxyisobutyrate dehydrogenase